MTVPKQIAVLKGKMPVVVLSNTKLNHCVFAWTPCGFHQFCKAHFPLGRARQVPPPPTPWHPSIDIPSAPREEKSTQIFVALKFHLRHLCPRWVIILDSNHILQNENNKGTFDQRLERRWDKARDGGTGRSEVLKVSGALESRNKLPAV